MKLITRFLYLSAAGIMLLTSCAKEQTESYDKFENQALEAWMTQNRRELLKNYQSEGGYYVEILDAWQSRSQAGERHRLLGEVRLLGPRFERQHRAYAPCP